MRLAILTTHPIQYYAPVFKMLHEANQIDIKVYYTWGEKSMEKFDPGFGKKIDWDIPLLQGYNYEWVQNTATDPGSHRFNGIINPQLTDQINQWQPHAILVYGWAYNSHLKAIRYFKNKIPVYFRGDSTLLNSHNNIQAFLRSIFLKWVYRHIDHAFYVGTNNKAYFKNYGLTAKQMSFAPHAIDNDRFAIDRADESLRLRQSLSISADDVLLLFAGKLEQKKSPELLLDAFLNLSTPYVHLLFIGNGEQENKLREKASGNNNIHFMGFQNQLYMPVIYQSCDLFCLPSKGPNETWGLAVNEAMAAGKAVLVSDKVGCANDLVMPGYTGESFESENLVDITRKLMLLTKDKATLRFLGHNAKNKIASWSFSNQVAAFLKIIN